MSMNKHQTEKSKEMLAKAYALAHRHKVTNRLPSLKEAMAKLEQKEAKQLLPNETFSFSSSDVNRSREVLKRLLGTSNRNLTSIVPLIKVMRG